MKRGISAVSVAAVLAIGGMVAPAFAADPWTGQYSGHSGSYHWKATIGRHSTGIYSVHVSVGSQMPACIGDFSGPAKLIGGKLLVKDDDCSLTISRRGPKGIRIEEKQCNAHGAACGFDSALTRTSANRAQTGSGAAGEASPTALDVPVMEEGGDGQVANCGSSTVSGLKANGDGFLAVRSGPGAQYRKLDELHNGDVVLVFQNHGNWAGIVYQTLNASCHSTKTRVLTYPHMGWVNVKWLKPLAG